MDALRVIGDEDTVLAFSLGGVPGRVVSTAEETWAAIESAAEETRRTGAPRSQAALLLVTYGAAESVRARLDALMLDAGAPLILEIPAVGDARRRSSAERLVARVLGVQT